MICVIQYDSVSSQWLKPKKILSSDLNFPNQVSTVKQTQIIPISKLWHTHPATVSSTASPLWRKNAGEKEWTWKHTTYLANCILSGWKSSTPHITSRKAELQQLIITTACNTELQVLQLRYLGACPWSQLMELVAQTPHPGDLPPCKQLLQ